MLPEQKTNDPHAVARFEQEMRAVGKLEHTNIVRAMDANEHEETHYLVMEYVDGVDLSELVHRIGSLPIADACELVRQAAIGLQHAHEHSLVHRDIKPSNLMMTKTGQLKILDLGLARLHNGHHRELTSAGQMMGTIDYMAPEQTGDSHDVDIRADIYGLGATLFKLLCARTPYAQECLDTMIKKLNALATQPVPSVREHRGEVAEELAAIVTKMLAKEPGERYATPQQVAEALEPFATGCDLSALLASYEEHRTADDETATPSIGSTEQYLTASMTETKSSKRDEAVAEPLNSTIDDEPNRDSIAPATTQEQTSGVGSRAKKIVATIAGIAALFVALTVIVIQTDKGDIRIISYDPDIAVTIKRNGEVIDGFQVKQRDRATSYFSGQYEIEIVGGNAGGVSIMNGQFKLTRGKDVLVEITRTREVNAAEPTGTPLVGITPFDAEQARQHQEAWAKHLGVPVEFTNSIGMKFRLIPPGRFLMGSSINEDGRNENEGPQHWVRLTQPFWIGATEVSVAQFQQFVNESRYITDAERGAAPFDYDLGSGRWSNVAGLSWRNPGMKQSSDHPVVCVSHNDASAFCQWLSEAGTGPCRLPTEAEWEYVCRAGTTTSFTFGASLSSDKANFNGTFPYRTERGPFLSGTCPVGSYDPNAWGVFDMHGNVFECCSDWYADTYFRQSSPADPLGPESGEFKVMRGGGWHYAAQYLRSAYRFSSMPGTGSTANGFRVVCETLPKAGHVSSK